MFIVNNFKEIIEICNNIDKNTYDKMREYVELNYNESKKYTDLRKNFKEVVEKILKIE
jgi:hypothetical protein